MGISEQGFRRLDKNFRGYHLQSVMMGRKSPASFPHLYAIPGTMLPSSHVSLRGLPESTDMKEIGCGSPPFPS